MTEHEDIREALVETAPNLAESYVGKPARPSAKSQDQHRRSIVRFLEEIDEDTTVGEILEALRDRSRP